MTHKNAEIDTLFLEITCNRRAGLAWSVWAGTTVVALAAAGTVTETAAETAAKKTW